MLSGFQRQRDQIFPLQRHVARLNQRSGKRGAINLGRPIDSGQQRRNRPASFVVGYLERMGHEDIHNQHYQSFLDGEGVHAIHDQG
jgi:hypothetical protein